MEHTSGRLNIGLKQVLYESYYKDNATKISDSFISCGGAEEAKAFLEDVAEAQA